MAASWEIAREQLNGAAMFKAASVCVDTCSGLKKLGFWCNGDPCNLGKGNAPFRCECEVQVGPIIGIVIGSIAAVACIASLIFACWLCMRPRTAVAVGHASAVVTTSPAYTYPHAPGAVVVGTGDAPQYGQHSQFQHAHQGLYSPNANVVTVVGPPQPVPYGAQPYGAQPTPVVMGAVLTPPGNPQYGYGAPPPPQQPAYDSGYGGYTYGQAPPPQPYGYRSADTGAVPSDSELNMLPPPPAPGATNNASNNPIVKFT